MNTATAVARSAPTRRVGTLDNQMVYWVGVKRLVKRLLKKDGWSQSRIAEELDLSYPSLHSWISQERLPLTVAKALLERFAPERATTASARWLVESSPRRPMASSKRCEKLAEAFDSRVAAAPMIRPISSARSAPQHMVTKDPTIEQLTRELDTLILTNARLVQERTHFAKELLQQPQHTKELERVKQEVERLSYENQKLREEVTQWTQEAEAAMTRAENAEAVLAATKIVPCAESLTTDMPQVSSRTLARAEELGVKLDLGAELEALPK